MREISKPSTAKCDLNKYILFLLSEPKQVSCVRLSEILKEVSHDSVNRFLCRENYTGKDLYKSIEPNIKKEGGVLSVDDTVLDKPYSDSSKALLINYFWSGKHKRVVKGINLITLYYTDVDGRAFPVNYRIYNKEEGKTKNEYFREMLSEIISWGLKPAFFTGDSWYASAENLECIKHYGLGFLFGIEKNRLVSLSADVTSYAQVATCEIPYTGIEMHLKGFGWVKIFRTVFKNEFRHYIIYRPDPDKIAEITRTQFMDIHDLHWQIESFHRTVKQVANIERERFFVRQTVAISNHIFAAISAFVHLQLRCIHDLIANCYALKRNLFDDVIRFFIVQNLANYNYLLPSNLFPFVNA
jgi:hypothetical protein